ncbi:MAG TPA: hypothetical protein VF665_08960 [Longimicrobium sp.]|uniref:hypothetical protein n=1 Tax=Longimicrobium sp. TaxID=2029185 RepID=UPI002EDADDFF
MHVKGFASVSLITLVLIAPAATAQGPVPDSCVARIVEYASRARSGAAPEYLLDLPAGPGRLLYFGAVHSSDPAEPQFAALRAQWERVRPTVAFYEGPPRTEAATGDETIRQYGESGYVRFLARAGGARIERLEPDPRDEARFVAARFPLDQVKLFYLLREASRLRERRGLNETQLREAMDALLPQVAQRIPEISGLITNTEELQAAYRRYWTAPANWWEAPAAWFDPLANSAETGGVFTNDINRASSEFRNRHMVEVIAREVRRGERVFAVVGRDHVPAQAPALRCALR